jgi:cyanophycin synthetase
MALSISTQLILEAAKRRGWQSELLKEAHNFYRLTDLQGHKYYVRNVTSHKTSGVGVYIAQHKDTQYMVIEANQLARLVPTEKVVDVASAQQFMQQHGQVVIKPTDQSHGDGVTVNITTSEQLQAAIALASSLSSSVIIQKQIIGDDYRLLFIGGKLAAAAIREPASVIGDGEHTIRELVELENQNPDRGPGYQKRKTFIDIKSAEIFLQADMNRVPTAGEKTQVVGTANIGKGGVSIDVTDTIDPELVAEAERLVSHLAIGMAGVDYIVTPEGEAYFIEINTAPSLGLHEYPSVGRARQTAEAFLDWLAD